MSGINKVILIGHVGKDSELRTLTDGVLTLSFPLATTEFVMKNGVKVEQTEWHHIIMWRGLAEAAHRVLKKGKLVYIEGKCRTRSYKDKNDVIKYIAEIIADKFVLLGRATDFAEIAAENPDII